MIRKLIDAIGELASVAWPVLVIVGLLLMSGEHDRMVREDALASACWDHNVCP